MGALVYIASPMRGDTVEEMEVNLEFARKASRYCALLGKVPITPHLYFSTFLRERIEVERLVGMKLGQCILPYCEELWVCGERISEGMRTEIAIARNSGVKISNISTNDIDAFLSCGNNDIEGV